MWTAADVLLWLQSNPKEAAKVLKRLKVAERWKKRTEPKRGGCDEWERVTPLGEEVAEVYIYAGESRGADSQFAGDGAHGTELGIHNDHATPKQARDEADACLRRRGWSLL